MKNGAYDAIVVGGGHNGLVSGAYFARAGARALVLEARDRVGGAADTSAPFAEHPEIKLSTYSYVMAVMPPTLIRELELERHGYRVAPVWGVTHPLPDGRAIQTFNHDPQRTAQSLAQFSKRDAETYAAWSRWLRGVGAVLGPLLLQVPPRLGSLAFGDLFAQAQTAWKLRGLGARGVADLTRLFTMSINDLLDAWFESEEVKATIAAGAVIGTWSGPAAPGTAYVLLHHAISDVGDGAMESWGYPHGGMGAVSEAIRRSAEEAGCEVRTATRVAKILTRAGRVQGVVLESGEELRAPVVVSAIHPQIAFLQLLERDELPGEFVEDIERWKSRSGTVKINLALSELPDFRFAPGSQLQQHHTGSLNLCFSPRYIERAFQDAHIDGMAATAPFVEGTIPSTLDPGLAPQGVHVFSMFSQWVPHTWNAAPHREELEAYADRTIDLYTQLAPNFRRAVIDRQVLGPYEMERDLGMLGGNIFHGELSLDQLFHMRPAPGYADYRTPIRGLYHASSATHAGGGVNGIPGLQAFRQAQRDRAIRSRS
ncbi:MAG: NAD(P)/FAD-dependent oxidoreductase [Myxococcales bacterium]|nr:NAD(P)/FAD-dependent oxidoreductase [Myxococcales bacterium]MDH5306710.1 NAD(P)/FAD-dependent oxidoreductase [Myxococcales bacterium]MDH5567990.1 NAD(P)/FAD-dependent oxidoreductase [Myxococcales bacterium]